MGRIKQRRYGNEFKRDLVAQVESGQITQSQAARQHEISPSLIAKWRQQIREGNFIDKPTAREKALEKELEQYKKKVGELTLVVDYFKKTLETSRRMRKLDSSVVSPRTLDRSKEPAE